MIFGLFKNEKPVMVRTALSCFPVKRSRVKRIDIPNDYFVRITTKGLDDNLLVHPGKHETLPGLLDQLVKLLIDPKETI